MSEYQGPYDDDVCHFCHKSAKNGAQHTAGYLRTETYARVGPWFPACEKCASKPYEQPKQFQEAANASTT